MTGARLNVGAYVELKQGVTAVEDLEDALCRVVGAVGELRDIRRVNQSTGALEGIEVRFLAAELRPARPASLRWYEALHVRAALAARQRAAVADAEDFGAVEDLVAAVERLVSLVLDSHPVDPGEVAVCGYTSDLDGAQVVEIDTAGVKGRLRVVINDGTVFDGDPETDEPPGAYYGAPWPVRRRWMVRSLITGDTETFAASSQTEATAAYLDTVRSNLLIWETTDVQGGRCGECGAFTDELISERHRWSCSLHPGRVGGSRP